MSTIGLKVSDALVGSEVRSIIGLFAVEVGGTFVGSIDSGVSDVGTSITSLYNSSW